MKNNLKIMSCLAAAFFLVSLSGCPDYSSQRPVPDYENMTDSADGSSEDDDVER